MTQIKDCFKSRFGGGLIVEADFSQLEVVVLALLSDDKMLQKDLAMGVDMHRKRAAELLSIPEHEVTEEERRLAKALSFQLQYGAGAKGLAESNGIPVAMARNFIELYYKRYPDVRTWQNRVIDEVCDSRKPTTARTSKGVPLGRGVYTSFTGRMFAFMEQDSSYSSAYQFSPTQLKNYPVQGTAADVMALFRGKMYRSLMKEKELGPRVLPINTVHDSIMYDIWPSALPQLVELLEQECRMLPMYIESLWGFQCPVSFSLEVKAGDSWGNMKLINRRV